MYGNGGILIYHVDETKSKQNEPGYPGLQGWPTNNKHYRVALIQADSNYDLEKNLNNGNAMDIFTKGTQLLPSSMITNGNIYPNTDSYQYGRITSTNIRIDTISESNIVMTFRVMGLGNDDVYNESPTTFTPAMIPSYPTTTEQPTSSSSSFASASMLLLVSSSWLLLLSLSLLFF